MSRRLKFKVSNPAQAGDAALALCFPEYKHTAGGTTYLRKTNIHVDTEPSFFGWHHGAAFTLSLWGVRKGIVPIPFGTNQYSFYDSLFAMNFTKSELDLLSHVIFTYTSRNGDDTIETENVDIYRLSDVEKNCIFDKREI